MATSFSNPFNLTAAGELGNHRESMLYNELLLRVSVNECSKIYFISLFRGLQIQINVIMCFTVINDVHVTAVDHSIDKK